jgi:hypothetical protein
MTDFPLVHLLRGPLNFLRLDAEELRSLWPEGEVILPRPRPVYLENETATPLSGFPILVSKELKALESALKQYLRAEEQVQVAIIKRKSFDSRKYNARWETYRGLLWRAIEDVTTSNYGRDYPQIFWLFHSLDVARILKESPKRIRRHDLKIGREKGDELKYQILHKYLDRAFSIVYDLVGRLSIDTEEGEEELFPSLLTRMRDNVLIFTEDHVSDSLEELVGYFQGYLKVDGRDLQYRLARLRKWHAAIFQRDRELRNSVAHLVGASRGVEPEELLKRPGYTSYLSTRPSYDGKTLLTPAEVQMWERLLVKLKEFELLQGLRRLIVRVEYDGNDHLVCSGRDASRIGGGTHTLHLSASTRPLDFMATWVIDPQVSRGGLIYDITDFSAMISVLRLSDRQAQDSSFRAIFRFQRRFDQLAKLHRLNWEKYLGDGAFYSGRDARQLLVSAIQMQRYYRKAVEEGFPFNRGMRIALNYGEYRLLPFGGSQTVDGERYEVFGHGVVELSRLVSGKATREIDEIKTVLVSKGYPEHTVNTFFAPLTVKNLDLVEKGEESRPFYAYLNRSGNLVNEGIVATARFIQELDKISRFEYVHLVSESKRRYVVIVLEEAGSQFVLGLRKLGMASLKGLERLSVYEVLDGGEWDLSKKKSIPCSRELLTTIDEAYTWAVATGKTRARGGSSQ